MPRRPLFIAVLLILLTLALAVSGLPGLLWRMVAGVVDTPRAAMTAAGAEPLPESVVRDEVVLRLEAVNSELQRRLAEYEELGPGSGIAIDGSRLVRCRVVARSDDDGRHFLELDRGALDGIRIGDPVLAGRSLVGVVRGEQASSALVQLLSDGESRVPATIQGLEPDANGSLWVADGALAGSGNPRRFALRHIEDRPGLAIEPGMPVVTAGLDPRIPPGLVLGRVAEAKPEPDGDLWDVAVEPLRPWGSYPTVLVLRGDGRTRNP